ncbi:MAG: hypothetical protein AAGD18_03790 [Actinomycetota bacterium]
MSVTPQTRSYLLWAAFGVVVGIGATVLTAAGEEGDRVPFVVTIPIGVAAMLFGRFSIQRRERQAEAQDAVAEAKAERPEEHDDIARALERIHGGGVVTIGSAAGVGSVLIGLAFLGVGVMQLILTSAVFVGVVMVLLGAGSAVMAMISASGAPGVELTEHELRIKRSVGATPPIRWDSVTAAQVRRVKVGRNEYERRLFLTTEGVEVGVRVNPVGFDLLYALAVQLLHVEITTAG